MIPPTEGFKSGFVSIIGKPNVGKSTLTNRLLGQSIAGVSAKPQTTRKRQLGIITDKCSQIIFVDTPGFHEPKDKLSAFINSEAEFALRDADVILFLVDGSQKPDSEDEKIAQDINRLNNSKVLLVINKCDLPSPGNLSNHRELYERILQGVGTILISAQKEIGLDQLLKAVRDLLPEGPQYYPLEQVTEAYEREIASEMIRTACLELLSDEVPYSVAVRIDEYLERNNGCVYINAMIIVEREAQKAIVIGKNGAMIKQIGSLARSEIEVMCGQNVFLDLSVKVRKDWKNDPVFLREIGLSNKK